MKGRQVETIGLWVTIAALAIGGIGGYLRFETRTDEFIKGADRWHEMVRGELEELRRVEVKELAEEIDGIQVALTRLQERQATLIDNQPASAENKEK